MDKRFAMILLILSKSSAQRPTRGPAYCFELPRSVRELLACQLENPEALRLLDAADAGSPRKDRWRTESVLATLQ
jgi:hypothetical protein